LGSLTACDSARNNRLHHPDGISNSIGSSVVISKLGISIATTFGMPSHGDRRGVADREFQHFRIAILRRFDLVNASHPVAAAERRPAGCRRLAGRRPPVHLDMLFLRIAAPAAGCLSIVVFA